MFAQIEATSPNINPGFYTRYGSLQAAPSFIPGTKALSVIWCNQSFPRSILKSDNSDYQDHYIFLFFSSTGFPPALTPLFRQRTVQNSKGEEKNHHQEIHILINLRDSTLFNFSLGRIYINAWKLNVIKAKEFRLCGWLPRMQPNSHRKMWHFPNQIFNTQVQDGERWECRDAAGWQGARVSSVWLMSCEHDKTACKTGPAHWIGLVQLTTQAVCEPWGSWPGRVNPLEQPLLPTALLQSDKRLALGLPAEFLD